ncbi:aconitate hydratase AcnA [Fredinandcohnia sp. FSL W7-1320]|uniref:aconitate hydratase AcnA n=1 Tax=Fredinandcohnia sp. FSL W7-1320 TaxID=2954540 RepID=UPI0030FDAF28
MYKKTLITKQGPVQFYDLKSLGNLGINVESLPFSIKIFLEAMMRGMKRFSVSENDLFEVATNSNQTNEIPFMPSRVIMQDASGIPALVDLVSLRERLASEGVNPSEVNPSIPVDLVVDHSLQVDHFGTTNALKKNVNLEYSRNKERYGFLKWAEKSFKNFRAVPPSNGIIHQVNLEYLAHVVQISHDNGEMIAHPEAIIGTDSHTTMINALGILGWGVGGIEAESVMLGYPISMLVPKVVGVEISGQMQEGVTATDAALSITRVLRRKNVVGKFVEFVGPGLKQLSLPDRATIANMAPEYGATMGFFPVDDETLKYLELTGKTETVLDLVERYSKEQGLFYSDSMKIPTYSEVIKINLSDIEPSISGPKRPQDTMPLRKVKASFLSDFGESITKVNISQNHVKHELKNGSIVIAAITSCTNTSNPINMIGAGLLAKKAVQLGLTVPSHIQTSFSPGSKVVTQYLKSTGLLEYMEKLGFYHVGYGCAVCVGNSGNLDEKVEKAIQENDLSTVAILSGNRNFEGRIHSLVKANYLASPPLVIAYAIAGKINIDLDTEPLGKTVSGQPVYLKDLWPNTAEIRTCIQDYINPELFLDAYQSVFDGDVLWKKLDYMEGPLYNWDPQSTYFKPSPFFSKRENASPKGNPKEFRALLALGDSITTDHISPVGSILKESAAGAYLMKHGVESTDFNTYGTRRGNHEVLVRGTFAHPRLQNRLVDKLGGFTRHLPSGECLNVFDAAQRYQHENIPLIIIAGKEYGTGSARDWAAKGTYLLGVQAVLAESFERIHRSNLAMMGILPLEFPQGRGWVTLGLSGEETFTILDLDRISTPQQTLKVMAIHSNGKQTIFPVKMRLDTQIEIELFKQGGIFQKVANEHNKKSTVDQK